MNMKYITVPVLSIVFSASHIAAAFGAPYKAIEDDTCEVRVLYENGLITGGEVLGVLFKKGYSPKANPETKLQIRIQRNVETRENIHWIPSLLSGLAVTDVTFSGHVVARLSKQLDEATHIQIDETKGNVDGDIYPGLVQAVAELPDCAVKIQR